MWIRKMVKDCLTENDGKSFCPVRCIGLAFSLPAMTIFLLAGARMSFQPSFPLREFAMSFSMMIGAICTGLGLGVAAKAFTDTRGDQ